jgi:hypothetical protein
MEEPEVNLKDPWLAAILAFLVPGLGHLYQRRLFKAAVYSTCILGLYAWGMSLSYGKIIQAPTEGQPRSKTFSFAAQAGVGLPAVYALYQAKRFNDGAAERVTSMPEGEELTAELTGQLALHQRDNDLVDEVTGTLSVLGDADAFGKPTLIGRFTGRTAEGVPVDVRLGEDTWLGPVLGADRMRIVDAPVVEVEGDEATHVGRLTGTIARSFWNWFQAPMHEDEEQQLHRELGKVHELALVFTWIAGLLNLLAIWDALEGPAYGYGLKDELAEQEREEPDSETADSLAAAATDAPAEAATAGKTG